MSEKQHLQPMVLAELDHHLWKNEIGPLSFSLSKTQLQWIKDLNMKSETLKLLEDIGSTLQNVGMGKDFLNERTATQLLVGTISKWKLIKLQSFCTAKETAKEVKRKVIEWEKIFNNYMSDRGLISRIHKELKKQSSKKTNDPIKKIG